VIECFHLAFLEALRSRVSVDRYVLKGGANLRYFFDSERNSEDIDLDIHGLKADWRFEEQVDSVLSSDALRRLLRAFRIAVAQDGISKPRQTSTTRCWRVPLTAEGHAFPIRTKIEFSDRNGDTRFKLEAVPRHIVAAYALRPPQMQHYLTQPATEQKVVALARRPETQARDVFDLELLFRHGGALAGIDEAEIKAAAEAAVSLSWLDFETQVVPFLDPEVAALYDETAWNAIQHAVAGKLLEQ
jgi:predicted nucleotidyltransferase component of viral defense system